MELTAEQQSILANVLAQLNEILQMQGGEAAGEPEAPDEMVEMSDDETVEPDEDQIDISDTEEKQDYDEEEDDKAEKSQEGVTATDDAEDRVEEDQPEEEKENITEVAKALMQLLKINKKRSVKKSRITKEDALLRAVNELVQVQKTQVIEQVEMKTVVNDILEGLGMTQKINKSLSGKTTKRTPRLQNPNAQAQALEIIQKAIGGKKEEGPTIYTGHGEEVRKGLTKALPGIFTVRK